MCPKIKSIFRRDGDDFMIIVIDNYDSFTYNLVHYIGEFEQDIKVIGMMKCAYLKLWTIIQARL